MPNIYSLYFISAVIIMKGKNREQKRSTWQLCPLAVLAHRYYASCLCVSSGGSYPLSARPDCGNRKAQLKGELCPCPLALVCVLQGGQSLGKNPSVSCAWAERESECNMRQGRAGRFKRKIQSLGVQMGTSALRALWALSMRKEGVDEAPAQACRSSIPAVWSLLWQPSRAATRWAWVQSGSPQAAGAKCSKTKEEAAKRSLEAGVDEALVCLEQTQKTLSRLFPVRWPLYKGLTRRNVDMQQHFSFSPSGKKQVNLEFRPFFSYQLSLRTSWLIILFFSKRWPIPIATVNNSQEVI